MADRHILARVLLYMKMSLMFHHKKYTDDDIAKRNFTPNKMIRNIFMSGKTLVGKIISITVAERIGSGF